MAMLYDNWKMVTLEPRDLATIEYLNEAPISNEVKDYLLKVYGKSGERDSLYQWQEKEYEKCLKIYRGCIGCGECGGGHPYFEESLLGLITHAIKDIESGRLDPETGEYLKKDDTEIIF
jgi:ferredoxin